MSEPFDSDEQANTALTDFFRELYELRRKYKLANVSLVVKDAIKGDGVFMDDAHCGNELERESMAAWLLGKMTACHQEMIRRAISAGSKGT